MIANFQVAFGKSLPLFISVYVCLAHSIITHILISYNQMCIVSFAWLHETSHSDKERENTWNTHTHTLTIFFLFIGIETSPPKTGTKYLLQTMKWYELNEGKATKNITKYNKSEHHKNLLDLMLCTHAQFSQWIRHHFSALHFFFSSFFSIKGIVQFRLWTFVITTGEKLPAIISIKNYRFSSKQTQIIAQWTNTPIKCCKHANKLFNFRRELMIKWQQQRQWHRQQR